jgi:hypothetical protein
VVEVIIEKQGETMNWMQKKKKRRKKKKMKKRTRDNKTVK